MKTTSAPKKLALYIALLAAVLTGAVELLFLYSPLENYVPLVASSMVIVFGAAYMLVWIILSDFFRKKINPIYTTVSRLRKSENSLRQELDKIDMEEDLNIKVESWASDRTQEIDQLKEMAKFRKEFLGNVSHELKTPIFNVQGYVLTLLDGGIDDPAINKLYLERAEKSIGRLINIVEDLDTISRLDSGEVTIKFANFDVVELIEEVFELQEMRAKKADIKLKFKKKQNKPIIVHADRARIQEVVINLLVNSIKYGTKKGFASVDFIDMEDNIMVEVSDNGLGIPKADLPRVFERFYRVDKSRSHNQGGTGLGLAIVKHIIEAHNQTINVRSKEGEGTRFTFTLMKGREN